MIAGSEPADTAVRPPLEWATITATRSLVVALPAAALPLLVGRLPEDRLLAVLLVHLGVVVAAGLVLTTVLMRRLGDVWYAGFPLWRGRLASAASVVALVTGMVALTTLASSAAFRYDPSLQFLQLLSALDIAWVTAATTIGVAWRWGRHVGVGAGVTMAAVCIWSIWTYLDAVGLGADGSWLVDGAALRRHVLPYDLGAAIIALTAVATGARRASGRTTTPSTTGQRSPGDSGGDRSATSP